MTQKFQPVIIGTDVNAYNVVRAFHMAYGVTSKVFGSMELVQVKYSRICDTTTVTDFYKDDVMIKTLVDYAKTKTDTTLILFAASENYVYRIFANYESLVSYYQIPYAPPEMGLYYSDKTNVYKSCEMHGLSYPKVERVNETNYQTIASKLDFPLIMKPIESTDYFALDFEGKEKVYILENTTVYEEAVSAIYANGYQHDMLLQEFVTGPPTNEYSASLYCNKQGKVTMLSLGQNILDHPDPEMRGNHLVIASPKKTDEVNQLADNIIAFLETIQFKGLVNFDFKWDDKKKEFKLLDFNLRQGRSSFYSVLSGANYAVSIVNDIYDYSHDMIIGDKPFIWLECTEDLFRKNYSRMDPQKYSELATIENIDNTLSYDADNSWLRRKSINRYLRKSDHSLKRQLSR